MKRLNPFSLLFVLISFALLQACKSEDEYNRVNKQTIEANAVGFNRQFVEKDIIKNAYLFEQKGNPAERELNLWYEFRDHPHPSDWQVMDSIVRHAFAPLDPERNPAVYYDFVLYSYDMLHRYLNRLPADESTNSARAYYLKILMAEGGNDLSVMTPAALALKDSDHYDVYKTYLLKCAEQQLKKYQPLLSEIEQQGDAEDNMEKVRYEKYVAAATETQRSL